MSSIPINAPASKTISLTLETLAGLICNRKIKNRKRYRYLKLFLKILTPYVRPAIRHFYGFQIRRIWRFISLLPEYLETACRSGSKTQDFCIAAFILCLGEPRTAAIWLAGNSEQLEQALEKIAWLLVAFTGRASERRTKISHNVYIMFNNGSYLKFNPMTQTSGGRYNLVVYDEGGKVEKKDQKKRYMDAKGLCYGTFSHPVRERHCTTLGIDTAIQKVYEVFEPIGLVFSLPVNKCPWAWAKYRKDKLMQQMPLWWKNIEYWCIMDAPGGKVFKKINLIDAIPHPVEGMYLRIGIDWMPAWGHAVTVAAFDGVRYYFIDEFRGEDIPAMAEFILRWQNTPCISCYTVEEGQGGRAFSRAKDLRDLGVAIDFKEPWDAGTQRSKIGLAQGLNENDKIFILKSLTNLAGQWITFHFNEEGVIPKQVDHHVDASLHIISNNSGFRVAGCTG